MDLAEGVYILSGTLPPGEQFGLVSQMRRAAVSVATNVAEGHARTRREYRNFVSIARGSVAELETLLELALRLGFVAPPQAEPVVRQANEVGRMLTGLRAALGDP